MKKCAIVSLLVAVAWSGASCTEKKAAVGMASGGSEMGWADPVIPVPVIPDRTFVVTAFGASVSSPNNARAIQGAIDAAGKDGGGTVVIPAGVYMTGPLTLVSNLHLKLEKGAVLKFVDDFDVYPVGVFKSLPDRHQPLVGADGLHDILIDGQGTMDGQGAKWWEYFNAHKKNAGFIERRPKFLCFEACNTVTIRGITVVNGPMFHMSPTHSENVLIEHVTVKAPAHSPNTDSCNPSGWNIVVRYCDFDIGDDNIAVKPFHKPAPRFAGDDRLSVENLYIHDCVFRHGHGLSVGGQTPGGLRNMRVRNIRFIDTDIGLRLKAERGDGGLVENVMYENITMENVRTPLMITSYYHGLPKLGEKHKVIPANSTTPIWRNVSMKNVHAVGGKEAGLFMGVPEMPISGLILENVYVQAAEPMRVGNVIGSTFKNVKVVVPAGVKSFTTEEVVEVKGLEAVKELATGK